MSDTKSKAPKTQLIVSGKTVELPAAKSKAAVFASSIIERLPDMIPPECNKVQFLCSLVVECNQLPANTTNESIAKCCLNAAQLGLVPGAALGHCHFVPFRRNRGKANEHTEAVLVVGYRGFIELGLSSGHLLGVTPELIYRGEQYERYNTIDGPHFRHQLDFELRDQAKPVLNNIAAAYCLWQSRDGYKDIVMVPHSTLERLAARQGNVWESDPLGMALKTPIRRASKTWKLTGRLARAVQLDEQAERDEYQSEPEGMRGMFASHPNLRLTDLAPRQEEPEPPQDEPEDEPESDHSGEPSELEKAAYEHLSKVWAQNKNEEAFHKAVGAFKDQHCKTVDEVDQVYYVADAILNAKPNGAAK